MNISSIVLFLSFTLIALFSSPAFSSPEDSIKRVFYYQDSVSGDRLPDSAVAFINGRKAADAKFLKIVSPEKCLWGMRAAAINESHYGKRGEVKNFYVVADIHKDGFYQSYPNDTLIFFKKWPGESNKNDTFIVIKSTVPSAP